MTTPAHDQTRPYANLARELYALRHRTVNPQTGRYFTQKEFAQATRTDPAGDETVSEKYVGTMERGMNRPSPDILRSMARVFSRHGAPCTYNDLAVLAGYADPPEVDPLFAAWQRYDRQHRGFLQQVKDFAVWLQYRNGSGQGDDDEDGDGDAEGDGR